jgi:TorA maturation chaperone TorD
MAMAAARETMYEFLSTSFSEPPSKDMLRALVAAVADGALVSVLDDSLDLRLESLQVCAEEALESEVAMRNLRQEFMDLFKVPGGKYVTPYESVYRDTREIEGTQVSGLLMGPSAIDAQRWYRLGAAEITDQIKDLPDHIAVELGFMAYLCRKEQEFALADDHSHLLRAREMERDFLASHIVPWIGDLHDRISKKSNHAYFRSVSQIAFSFARDDLSKLQH